MPSKKNMFKLLKIHPIRNPLAELNQRKKKQLRTEKKKKKKTRGDPIKTYVEESQTDRKYVR